MIVALVYGARLRLQECLGLRVKDIDVDRRQIVIRRGKGQNDDLHARSSIMVLLACAALSIVFEGVAQIALAVELGVQPPQGNVQMDLRNRWYFRGLTAAPS